MSHKRIFRTIVVSGIALAAIVGVASIGTPVTGAPAVDHLSPFLPGGAEVISSTEHLLVWMLTGEVPTEPVGNDLHVFADCENGAGGSMQGTEQGIYSWEIRTGYGESSIYNEPYPIWPGEVGIGWQQYPRQTGYELIKSSFWFTPTAQVTAATYLYAQMECLNGQEWKPISKTYLPQMYRNWPWRPEFYCCENGGGDEIVLGWSYGDGDLTTPEPDHFVLEEKLGNGWILIPLASYNFIVLDNKDFGWYSYRVKGVYPDGSETAWSNEFTIEVWWKDRADLATWSGDTRNGGTVRLKVAATNLPRRVWVHPYLAANITPPTGNGWMDWGTGGYYKSLSPGKALDTSFVRTFDRSDINGVFVVTIEVQDLARLGSEPPGGEKKCFPVPHSCYPDP